MCGICGIIDLKEQPVKESKLHLMMESMKHRGPDDEGVFIHNNLGFGFVRLSIIDLSAAGHQPMVSADGRYVIIFNGEIYNYIELREELKSLGYSFVTQTDTEVLLASYILWGEDCLHRFNGMWAFVILDKFKNEIFGARDRFGVKPFYYSLINNQFIFASDISSILSVLYSKPTVHEQAVFDFLVFNRTDQNEKTFFNEVNKLPHGCKFKTSINRFQFNVMKWYDLRSNLKSPFETPEELRNMLASSIGLRLRSDVPVGVCFSGGIDSSAIVSTILNNNNKSNLNTFSAVYGEGVVGDESGYINEYRSQLSQMHSIIPTGDSLLKDIPEFIKAHGEPIPSTSPYAQYKVMELASKNVVVTLDGQGADEQFAGYHYFFGFYFKDLMLDLKWSLLMSEISSYLKNHKALYGLSSLFFFLLPNSLRAKARIYEKGYLLPAFIKKHEGSTSISSSLYSSSSLHNALMDHFEYKLEHLLKWEDKNSMWFSIEARTPFLDYRLVERSLSLPSGKIIKNGTTKYILREAMKDSIPASIYGRKDKTGFETPQNDWFRQKNFQSYITSLISSESFRSRNIINVMKINNLYNNHLSQKSNRANEIWKIIHLENWYREFID
jgi:asparagine synthase (glutamine-hydrolysing)